MHIFIVDIIHMYVSSCLSSYRTRRPRSFSFLPYTLHANTQTIYSVCFSVGRAAEVLGRHSQITTPDVFELSTE